jgi:hypothetical protein
MLPLLVGNTMYLVELMWEGLEGGWKTREEMRPPMVMEEASVAGNNVAWPCTVEMRKKCSRPRLKGKPSSRLCV